MEQSKAIIATLRYGCAAGLVGGLVLGLIEETSKGRHGSVYTISETTHQNGSYVLFADAQATIAALQARR